MAEQEVGLPGKVCLITGATSGIGEAAALEMAKLGVSVVLVGRSAKKCTQIVEQIKSAAGNSSVDFLVADLSSQKDIHHLAEEFKNRYPHLDVLVNNVGGIFLSRLNTVDGVEMTFALNHLSYFLLTHLLLDSLIAGAPARIINITSAIHKQTKLNINDLEYHQGYDGFQAYAQSKRCNLLFTYELARRLQGTNITVNALHPGFVSTNLGKNNVGFLKPLLSLIRLKGIHPEEAAQSIIYLASSPEMAEITGCYFEKERTAYSLAAYDQVSARLLWELSANRVGLVDQLEKK